MSQAATPKARKIEVRVRAFVNRKQVRINDSFFERKKPPDVP